MSDKVDDLIQQMQHLEASSKAAGQARVGNLRADKLKTQALKLAAQAQSDLDLAEKKLAEGEAKLQTARTPGLPPLEAADLLLEGRALVQENKPAVIKARAKLNFALDRMDDADRESWQALQAEARAEAHAQLSTELFPGGVTGDPLGGPAPTASTSPTAAAAPPSTEVAKLRAMLDGFPDQPLKPAAAAQPAAPTQTDEKPADAIATDAPTDPKQA